jgi:hypothetical protein
MNKTEAANREIITVKDLVNKLSSVAKFLISKWLIIFLFGAICGSIGLFYAITKPVSYLSEVTFVVEDNKSGGSSLMSLAGQFGFDIGSGGGGGIISDDNIMLFLKSENLCRETLLSSMKLTDSMSFADRYASLYGYKKIWVEKKLIASDELCFSGKEELSRVKDSLLQMLIQNILQKELFVVKPDKKSSFVQVQVLMRDESLSFYFSKKIVELASKRYVDSKTRLKLANVNLLQTRADSLGKLLENKTYKAASNQQALIDVNPAIRSANVSSEISAREKTMISSIFSEVVKNLEISKTVLSQETPVIEIVNESYLPLKKSVLSKSKSFITGFVIGGFLIALILIFNKWLKSKL